MAFVRESVTINGRPLTFETGRLAKQAHGAVLITYGESVVLVTAVSGDERPGLDFFPLTCEYVEKTFAAGKIPGGFFKREGRQRDEEILTCRIMDRPLRPLFPEGYKSDTQVIASVLSADKVNPTDALAVTGASAALHISDIPWAGPLAGVRVARVNGDLIAFPTFEQLAVADIDLMVACSKDAVVMVEGGAAEASEADVIEALMFARKAALPIIELIERMRAAVGKAKRPFEPKKLPEEIAGARRRDRRRRHPRVLAHQGQEGAVRRVQGRQGSHGRDLDHRARAREVRRARETHQSRVRRAQVRGRPRLRPRPEEAHRRSRHGHGPPHRDRGRHPPACPRVRPLPARRDAGRGHDHPGDVQRRAEDRRAHRRALEALPLPLQLPALLDGRDQADARPRPPRDRPRRARGARAVPDDPRAGEVPLHDPHRQRDARVKRLLVDGRGLRRHAVADGRRRPHQGARRRHRHGAHLGRQAHGHPDRHPRRRGPPRRHGLQGLRDVARHHRHPDGHQDRRALARGHDPGARAGARRTHVHPRQDDGDAAGAARGALQVRTAHHHHQGQAGPDPPRHRPGRQDHQGDHRPDGRGDRRRGRRHGQRRVVRRGRREEGARHHQGADRGARGRGRLQGGGPARDRLRRLRRAVCRGPTGCSTSPRWPTHASRTSPMS